MGTEHSVTKGCFQKAEIHWPLSGNQSWKVTVASVPSSTIATVDLGSGAWLLCGRLLTLS